MEKAPRAPWTTEEFHEGLERDRKKSQEELLQDHLERREREDLDRGDAKKCGEKTQYAYALSQEEIDDIRKGIKEDYKESYLASGKSEEEFEAFWRLKELEEQRQELERQKLKQSAGGR